jgi:hypothetical protein
MCKGTDRLSSTIAEVTKFSMHTAHSGTTYLPAALRLRSLRKFVALLANFFLGPILITPAGWTGRARACDTQLLDSTYCTRQRVGRHAGGEYASWRGLGSPTILFKFFFRKLRQCFNINHLPREMHRQAHVEQRCFSILFSAILTVRPRLNEGVFAEDIRQERCVAPRATASADH